MDQFNNKILYSFSKWTKTEQKKLDKRSMTLFKMHNIHHSKRNIDKFYLLRKEGGRKLLYAEDTISIEIFCLKNCVVYCEKRILPVARNIQKKFSKQLRKEGRTAGQIIGKRRNCIANSCSKPKELIEVDRWKSETRN